MQLLDSCLFIQFMLTNRSHLIHIFQLLGLSGNLKDARPPVVKVFTNTLEFVLELVTVQKEMTLNLSLVLISLHVVSCKWLKTTVLQKCCFRSPFCRVEMH